MSTWPAQAYVVTHDISNRLWHILPILEILLMDEELEGEYERVTGEVKNSAKDRAADVMRSWQFFMDLAHRLRETYETDMSPALLFDVGPLADLPQRTRRWLRPMVHDSWMARFQIDERLQCLAETLGAADRAFLPIAALLQKPWPWSHSDTSECFALTKEWVQQVDGVRLTILELETLPTLAGPSLNTEVARS